MINDKTSAVGLGGGLPKDSEAGKGGAGAVRDQKIVRIDLEAGAGEGEPFRQSTFYVRPEHLVSRGTPPEWRGADYAKQQAEATMENRFGRAFMEVDEREVQEFVTEMRRKIELRDRPKGSDDLQVSHEGPDDLPVSHLEKPEKSPLEKALEIDLWSRIDGKFKK